jgi:hypothetical protein
VKKKLEMKSMRVVPVTFAARGSRAEAKALIQAECESMKDAVPPQMCQIMTAAVGMDQMMYQKEDSTPLNDDEGAHFAVWLWVQKAGEDLVDVAFKAGWMKYALRDVIEYKEKKELTPVIKCEETRTETKNGWFSTQIKNTENCREVSTKETVTQVPIYQKSVMNLDEMDVLKELMTVRVSQKVLDTAGVKQPLLDGPGASA